MAKRYHQSKRDRFREHSGEERALHGYRVTSGARHAEEEMYDRHMLRHERPKFNDSDNHDARPEESGSRWVEQYAGREGRRRQEMMDAGMISEDHTKVANLPQEVIMHAYPKAGHYTPEDLDDTLHGVDRQINFDDSQKMRHFFPKKV